MELRPSSMIRAAGAALAATTGDRVSGRRRALLLAGSDLAAKKADPVGLQPLAITPSGDLDAQVSIKPDVVTALTGATTWAARNLGVDALLRRLRVPAVLRGAAVGAAVYATDLAVSAQQSGTKR
jgi:hypothetical protein